MENFYGDSDRRVGSLRGKGSEPSGERDKIRPEREFLPHYPEDTAARARSMAFKKQNPNYPEYPERRYDSTSHEIPEGCNSSSATRYPNYNNHQYAENVGRMPTNYTKCTGDKGSGEKNICREPMAYRSSSNAIDSLTSSSASSDSDQSWEEPSKKTSTNIIFESKKGRKGKMQPKNQKVNSPNAFLPEELSIRHENWQTESKSRNETLPEATEKSQLRTSATKYKKNQTQNYRESYDRRHDSNSRDVPEGYRPLSTTYASYGDRLCEANTDDCATKFTSSIETDKQTEAPKSYEETDRVGRRNFHRTSRVACNSRQKPAERTGPYAGLKNEKKRDQRTRREMKPMIQTDNGHDDFLQEESSSDYSDHCAERRSEISPDNRNQNWPAEDGGQYWSVEDNEADPIENSRRNEIFPDRRGQYWPSEDSRRQYNEADSVESSRRRNKTFPDRGGQHWPAEDSRKQHSSSETDSDDSATRRNETFPDRRRRYGLGEDRRRQYCFKEAATNPTLSAKDQTCYRFSQTTDDTKSRNTKCDNQSRTPPPRWENEKTTERSYPERGVYSLDALGSNQDVPINRDHALNWPENYQVQENEIGLKCENRSRKGFVEGMSYGRQEPRDTAYFHHETEEQDLRDQRKLFGRRANDNYNERKNGVIQHNTSVRLKPGMQERGNNEKQMYQENQYKNKMLMPEFYSDYLHPGNDFHERVNSSGKQEPCQDVRYRENNFWNCDNPVFFQNYQPDETESNRYGRCLPNSASGTIVKNCWNGSDYDPRKYEKSVRFTVSESQESASVRRTGRVCKSSYESVQDWKDGQQEQPDFYLEQISKDSQSLHASNMLAVKSTVIDDINVFGTKLSEAILSCHVSLQLFRATYVEWLKTRDTTLRISRALEEEIRRGGNWQSGVAGFCSFLKTAGSIAENVLKLTPYATVAVPVIRVVPTVVEKVGSLIMGTAKGKKKEDSKCLDILQVLKEDIEESSQLKMFALQCETQFKETEGLFIEFLNAISNQQMADAVEDMPLLNFIIDFSEADPGSDGFFRRVSQAYRKFYSTGREESSATTREAFCSIIDRDPTVLDTLQGIDWHFTRSFQNQREENDLSMCWATISGLANSTNPEKAEDALRGISTIIRILETQRNYVNANVSRLFSTF